MEKIVLLAIALLSLNSALLSMDGKDIEFLGRFNGRQFRPQNLRLDQSAQLSAVPAKPESSPEPRAESAQEIIKRNRDNAAVFMQHALREYAFIEYIPKSRNTRYLANSCYPHITTLHMYDPGMSHYIHGHVTPQEVENYGQMFPNINVLFFDQMELTDATLQAISRSFPRARNLIINDLGYNYANPSVPLRTFDERQLALLSQGPLAQQLKTLIIQSPSLIITRSLYEVLERFTQLHMFSINGEKTIRESSLSLLD